jgi:hypothetical protein
MREEQAEKLIEYVSSMVDYDYNVQPNRIYSETESRSDETSESIKEIYSSIEGKRFCTECETMKMYDTIRGEWYCPYHQFSE